MDNCFARNQYYDDKFCKPPVMMNLVMTLMNVWKILVQKAIHV